MWRNGISGIRQPYIAMSSGGPFATAIVPPSLGRPWPEPWDVAPAAPPAPLAAILVVTQLDLERRRTPARLIEQFLESDNMSPIMIPDLLIDPFFVVGLS